MKLDTAKWKRARNGVSWAIGTQRSNGFHVRRVVWGYLMASMEVRPGEQIRAAIIVTEPAFKPRRNPASI